MGFGEAERRSDEPKAREALSLHPSQIYTLTFVSVYVYDFFCLFVSTLMIRVQCPTSTKYRTTQRLAFNSLYSLRCLKSDHTPLSRLATPAGHELYR